jgi:hypothetical protein
MNDLKLINYNPDDYKDDTYLNLNPLFYHNYGNYHNRRMPLKKLIRLPFLEQTEFSDAICRRYAKNKLFQEKMETYITCDNYTKKMVMSENETGVGNMAFMALHNPDSIWPEMYEKMKIAIEKYGN